MKKLIVMGVAVIMAVAANAASFAWQALAIPKNGDASSVGYAAYLIDSSKVSRADMIAALSTGDFSNMTAANYLLTTTTSAQGTTGISRISLTSGTAASTVQNYSAYMVVLDGAVGSAQNFLVSQELANVNNPGYDDGSGPGLGNVQLSFGSQATATWTAVAPEPTSGLLMLVGLGALALRRRKV